MLISSNTFSVVLPIRLTVQVKHKSKHAMNANGCMCVTYISKVYQVTVLLDWNLLGQVLKHPKSLGLGLVSTTFLKPSQNIFFVLSDHSLYHQGHLDPAPNLNQLLSTMYNTL